MFFRFSDWLRKYGLKTSSPYRSKSRTRHPARSRSFRVKPTLEILEGRLTPSYDILTFSGAGLTTNIAPNQPSGAIAVQLQDNSGNAIVPTSNLTVKQNSNSSTGEFLDLSGKPLANSSIVIPAGSSFAYFEYEGSQTGNAAITGQTYNPSAFGGAREPLV